MRSQRIQHKPLPNDSLRLLAPPLRLASAAVWTVMLQRDVMHFGKLEEFVKSISETVQGLLNYRHQAKLTVGLGARLILEQLRVSQSPDPKIILPQLERLRAPTPPTGRRKDEKVEMAVKNFHTLVHNLLKNQAERRRFFQEEFDAQYGPHYDSALEKLLWEFLTRLDQLLPVPDFKQTVSWLSSAPAVLEECARSATQPQLLKTLLQHEKCLGHLNSTGSIPSSTGDSILSSLSFAPSGSEQGASQPESTPETNTIQSPAPSTKRSSSRQTSRIVSEIAPVVVTISSKDLPKRTTSQSRLSFMERDSEEEKSATEDSSYASVNTRSSLKPESPVQEEFLGSPLVTVLSQSSTSTELEDSDENQRKPVRRSGGRRSVAKKQDTRSFANVLEPDRTKEQNGNKSQRTAQDVTSQEDEATGLSQSSTSSELEDSDENQRKPVRRSGGRRSVAKKQDTRSSTIVLEPERTKKKNGNKSQRTAQDVTSQEDEDLLAVLSSQTHRQLKVVIPRLDIRGFALPVFPNITSNEEQARKSPRQSSTKHVIEMRNGDSINRKRKLSCRSTPEKNLTGTTDKQICAGSPCIPTVKPVMLRSSEKVFPLNESTDDIIVDSEDEAAERVKGRLFTTRYCKTKNNTYIPTLNEFCNPFLFPRDIVSPGNGSR